MCMSLALTLSLASFHLSPEAMIINNEPLNELNPGIAIECSVNPYLAAEAGLFINSYSDMSKHFGALVTTDSRRDLVAGIHLGLVDGYGYNGGKFGPAVRPFVQYKAVRVGFIPPVNVDGNLFGNVVTFEITFNTTH